MRRSPGKAMAAGVLTATAVLLTLAIPGGAGAAQPGDPERSSGTLSAAPRAGALPAPLTPSTKAALLSEAQAGAPRTAAILSLGGKERLIPKSVSRNADGARHTRYERTYDGLPVLGGDLIVHENPEGAITGVDKATNAPIEVPTTEARHAPQAAANLALGRAEAEGTGSTAVARAPRKVVWAAGGVPVLAWESVVGGVWPDGTPSELHVITDATTGARLYEYEAIRNGTGHSQYSGQVVLSTAGSAGSHTLRDDIRGGHQTYNLNRATSGRGTAFTDADDVWGDGSPANPQTAAVDAAYGAQVTWDFYKTELGRDGIRDNGVAAYSRVHYGTGYVNAFWDDGCFCMTYGDGRNNSRPLTQIDIVGHEMTHGVTSATAGLVYSGESGGLNEATSDILGTAVEFSADNAGDPGDYLMGEKIDINGNNTPLRYQDKPSRDGRSPDNWYAGIGGIDVHYSSGPANHFFYLLSEGSGAKTINGVTYNSPTADNLPVTGIGRENAARLWYKALDEKFTSNTNYADARTKTLQAAGEMWGTGGAQYNAVASAWAAIGVGARPSTGSVSVTRPADRSTTVGTAASLQIQATGTTGGALTYAATGLPAGLVINASTGLISGTPTAVGTHTVTVTVKDAAGNTGTTTFAWTVTPATGGVTVTRPPDQSTTVGTTASLQIQATGTTGGVLTYAATGLPAGLVINASTGLISGTPTAVGTHTVTVTATGTAGTGSATFTWRVTPDGSGGDGYENATRVDIPDATDPVGSAIPVSDRAGNAPATLRVTVDITHPRPGDLFIQLVLPNGESRMLKYISGWDGPADVKTTYTVDASSAPANGTWTLRVQDVFTGDVGHLNGWKLVF